MLEKHLIEHCSPTLASLKTANLFCCEVPSHRELRESVRYWNACFAKKGITLRVLRENTQRALVYVCRRKRLAEDFLKPGAADFLRAYGYDPSDIDGAIDRLSRRLCGEGTFPHEIGLFLGYPLDDVKGFIENAGQNCLCCGCWKVYCNECEALQTFQRFDKCRKIYLKQWKEGKSVLKLAVSA